MTRNRTQSPPAALNVVALFEGLIANAHNI
jgi:hypothetical protein